MGLIFAAHMDHLASLGYNVGGNVVNAKRVFEGSRAVLELLDDEEHAHTASERMTQRDFAERSASGRDHHTKKKSLDLLRGVSDVCFLDLTSDCVDCKGICAQIF